MDSLEGKTAVVTGAASGIGRALAERFAGAGMNVVLADVETGPLSVAAESIRTAGGRALAVPTDVSSYEQVLALRDAALESFGRVNVLCNNAGVSAPGNSIEDWEWVLGVNLWGVIHGHLAFLPHLLEHGDGHVVNTSSLSGLLAVTGGGPYTASKHAVVGMTEALYHELARQHSPVGVSCLCPYYVATNITSSERNRPARLRHDAPESLPISGGRTRLQDQMIQSGQSPSLVAQLVHEAIIERRFWVFTSDDALPFLESRWRSITGGTNPVRRPPGV